MRHALVTGGNRGIGLAIATALARQGMKVTIGVRDRAAGQDIASKIGASAVQLDVADPDSIAEACDGLGQVDVLINNAGVPGTGSILDDPDDFERSMAVMVRGPYLLMHHLTPPMAEAGYGRIVNLSSGWGAFSDGVAGPAA